MSRIGKNPVAIPAGVEVKIVGNMISAKGKLGELSFSHHSDVKVELGDDGLLVSPLHTTKQARALWGTSRARLQNMVSGVVDGFKKELHINGVGYRAAVKGANLELQLGYSHDVVYAIPAGISITCAKPTEILIEGADKQQVGQVAANIREFRAPEPYKGKGIKYSDEQIVRKEGKKK